MVGSLGDIRRMGLAALGGWDEKRPSLWWGRAVLSAVDDRNYLVCFCSPIGTAFLQLSLRLNREICR